MNTFGIEQILKRNNIESSDELVKAIAEIIDLASKDKSFIREIKKGLDQNQRFENYQRGIR